MLLSYRSRETPIVVHIIVINLYVPDPLHSETGAYKC